jgi:membrane protease YdiL (CAAX protease family)
MPMNKPAPQSDSPRKLIVAAIGWYILAIVPVFVTGAAQATYEVVTRQGISGDILYLRNAFLEVADGGIILAAALIKGRALGHGNTRAGLGDGPILNRPIIALIAVLLGAHIMVDDVGHPDRRNELLIVEDGLWQRLYAIFISVILIPLAEELFFRGWLWTGLRRHWGALPTAVVTSALFLAIHWPNGFPSLVAIIPLTIVLGTARHLGGTVRASIAVHMMNNLTVLSV